MILTLLVVSLWRRGSVFGSWLLDLTADVLLQHDPKLSKFDGGVSDSGEGRWTLHAAVDLGVPTPVISAALFERFKMHRRLGEFRQNPKRDALYVWRTPCQIKSVGFVTNVVAKDVNTAIKVGENALLVLALPLYYPQYISGYEKVRITTTTQTNMMEMERLLADAWSSSSNRRPCQEKTNTCIV